MENKVALFMVHGVVSNLAWHLSMIRYLWSWAWPICICESF